MNNNDEWEMVRTENGKTVMVPKGALKRMTRYRFRPEDFEKSEGEWTSLQCAHCSEAAEIANARLAEWERESQKLYGFQNVETGEIQVWSARGKAKLKREDYTHVAVVWNPRKFEEVK